MMLYCQSDGRWLTAVCSLDAAMDSHNEDNFPSLLLLMVVIDRAWRWGYIKLSAHDFSNRLGG
jgi:hypothetical protein